MQVSEVHERKLGQGLDNRNAENQLMPGFWEILKNAETDGDIVRKRSGYQQLGGYLPFRVQSIESSGGQICFNLDSYVDLSRLRSSPLVVRGTTYADVDNIGSDFPTGELKTQYYTGFDVSIRKTGTSFVIPQPSHGHNSWIQHSNIYESLSESDLTNSLVYPDTHNIVSPDLTGTTLTETNLTTNQQVTII